MHDASVATARQPAIVRKARMSFPDVKSEAPTQPFGEAVRVFPYKFSGCLLVPACALSIALALQDVLWPVP